MQTAITESASNSRQLAGIGFLLRLRMMMTVLPTARYMVRMRRLGPPPGPRLSFDMIHLISLGVGRCENTRVTPCVYRYIISDFMLVVDALVGEVLVVKVMFEFRHVGGDIDAVKQLFWKVPTSKAEAGPRVSLCEELLEIIYGE